MAKAFICTFSIHLIAFSAIGDWTWQNPKPQGNTLRSIQFLSSDTGFIGGDGGVFLRTYDGGINWSVSKFPGSGWVYAIGFRDSQTGLALQGTGSQNQDRIGGLYQTQNGGENWARILTLSGISDNPIQWVDRERVFLATDSVLRVSQDGGHNWSECGLSSVQILSYTFITSNHGYVLAKTSAGHTILRTMDGCSHFDSVPLPNLDSYSTLRFLDSSSAFLAGSDAHGLVLLRSEDGARTWSEASVAEPRPVGLLSLSFTNNKTGYGIAPGGTLLKTQDGGLSWTNIYTAPPETPRYLQTDILNEGIAYRIGWYGLIEKSIDGGASWREISHGVLGSSGSLSDVSFSDINTGIAVGGNGTDQIHHGILLRTTNAGGNWDTVSIPTVPYLTSVRFRDASLGLAVGDSGVILTSSDRGATWEQMGRVTDADLNHVGFGLGNNIIACGRRRVMLRSRDGGRSWNTIISDSNLVFNSLDIRPTLVGMAAGYRSIGQEKRSCIFRTLDGGDTWKELPLVFSGSDTLMVPLRAVNVISAGNAYVADENGVLLHSHDDGITWDSISTLGSPSPRAMRFFNVDSGFVAFNGGLNFTQDGGHTWTRQLFRDTPPFISALAFPQGGNGYAVGEMGAILTYQRAPTSVRRLIDPVTWPRLVVDGGGIHYIVDSKNTVIVRLAHVNGALISKLAEGIEEPGEHYLSFPSQSEKGPWVVDISIGKSRYQRLITNRQN